MTFGKAVRVARKGVGMTISEVARRLGVTKVYVSDVELGRRAPFTRERIDQIAEILDADPLELYVLAVRSRGHVKFHTEEITLKQNRLAAVLSYRWSELSDDDVTRLMGAL